MPTAVVIASLLLFARFWCGLLALLARISGWTAIAAPYRATGAKDGRTLRMNSFFEPSADGTSKVHAVRLS